MLCPILPVYFCNSANLFAARKTHQGAVLQVYMASSYPYV
uniref:Uncharacterized protein n=1 Tax=Anguilla anguilla TaxID=7936 RepID=A0A0E9QK91_ANGAN